MSSEISRYQHCGCFCHGVTVIRYISLHTALTTNEKKKGKKKRKQRGWVVSGHADEALRSFYEQKCPLAQLFVALGQYCHA